MAATADRVLGVLALFTGLRSRWTVEEAAEALDLTLSTAYRYFRSLAEADLLSSSIAGYYTLGPAVCVLDRAMRLNDPFIHAAMGEMEKLATAYPKTIILLTRLYKNTVMCVHREGEQLRASGYERGRPMPLHRGAASKAILANLPPRTLRSLMNSDLSDPPVDMEDLRSELRQIKAQGYSLTRGEIDTTKIGISVPVFRGDQSLEGSLSFVLDASDPCEKRLLVETLIRSRKVVEANLLISDYLAFNPGNQHAAKVFPGD
ncbi:IclR family transcriptional regulator [Alteraurantiacibacter buctensis]|nr:IclR family transcriptional regulator C-terminal domain-containing protein [Alteraurantiacibacter buctensis]